MTEKVASADGTVIAFDRCGVGPAVVLVHGAFTDRTHPTFAAVAAALAPWFTVFNYDAALALRAAVRNPAMATLAVWEPPFHVDGSAPHLPDDFAVRLAELVEHGRRADAVGLFMVAAAEVPAETLTAMRGEAGWPATEAIAHTLAYEAAVLGPGNALPAERLTAITQPTLVLNGENSPVRMTNAGKAVAYTVPRAASWTVRPTT